MGPGAPSEVWRYRAELLKGPKNTVSENPDSYLGPTIRLRRGQTVKIHIHNELPEDTTVHWHGLHVPSDVDGQPRLPIRPGETMTVGFEVLDRAGLFWYHSHAHGKQGGRVGFQSYAGLAGLLIVEDEEEADLKLPSGDNELLLVLQDRTFAGNNELVYLGRGMGSMMDRMHGFLGDRVLANGAPPTTRKVATRPYRIRVLDGSNARPGATGDLSPLSVQTAAFFRNRKTGLTPCWLRLSGLIYGSIFPSSSRVIRWSLSVTVSGQA